MKESESKEKFYEFIDQYMNKKSILSKQVKQIFDENWEDFIKQPASSSGKYHHPAENYKPFGLLNHTMRTVWFANELSKEEKMNEIQIHKVIAAALLHDLGKIQTKKSSHGKQSLEMIEDIIDDQDVHEMVLRHMHMWSDWPAGTIYATLVAYADYFASRKEIEITSLEYFKKDKEISEEYEKEVNIINKTISEEFEKEENEIKSSKRKKKTNLMDF